MADLDYYHLVKVFEAFKFHFIKHFDAAETFKKVIACFKKYIYQILLDEAYSNVDIESIIRIEVANNIDSNYPYENRYMSYRVREEIKNRVIESILEEGEEQMEYLIDKTDSLLNIDKLFNVDDLKDKLDKFEIDNELDDAIDNEIDRRIAFLNESLHIDYDDTYDYEDEEDILEDDWSRVDRLFQK